MNQRIHFAALMLKSRNEAKVRHEDRTTRSKMDRKRNIQFVQILNVLKSFKFIANKLDINFTGIHCILMITF